MLRTLTDKKALRPQNWKSHRNKEKSFSGLFISLCDKAFVHKYFLYRIFSWLRYTTALDRIIIGFACALLIMSVFLPMTAASGNRVRVVINNELQYQGELFEENTLSFQGALGALQVETGTSGVRVSQSTCRNQVCMRQGWLKSNGAVIVCIPNNLVIFITSHHEQQLGPLDTTTR